MSIEIELEDQRSPEEEQGLLESRHTILPEEHSDYEHTIFLSHSGAQKNFVEQLCEDLERAKQSPFFDKRPESLPKGEVFARHIFRAAEQCEVAVVVVSEEYFSRSKWPMLELCAFVRSSKCKVILPLFFGLSCKEFGNLERRERWFGTWHAWAQADARIRVEDWKNALRELDRRNGLEYVEALGEVVFRKDVVATVYAITQKILQEKVLSSFALICFCLSFPAMSAVSASENEFVQPCLSLHLKTKFPSTFLQKWIQKGWFFFSKRRINPQGMT
jgi:hypothetical protein